MLVTDSQSPKLGILLPSRGIFLGGEDRSGISHLFELAQMAENAQLDSVWVGDSLFAKPRLEPLATLAAVAVNTSHIRLGTAVLLAPLRHPVQLAQMAATVDLISNGRLIIGMGVGGVFTEPQKNEWNAVGISHKERGSRMTEIMQVCRRLWTEDEVTFDGRFFKLDKVIMDPKPAQPGGVPMLLACHATTGSESQYRRAALYSDGVIGISDSPAQYADTISKIRDYSEDIGRDANGLHRVFYMTVNINRDRDVAWREADDFIKSYYGLNFWAEKWGPFGPPEEVATRILEYVNAGVQEVVVRFAARDQTTQFHHFVQEVVPTVRDLGANLRY
jgi:alkanesulfonate monooxygenase SsuD/methylene tetrahydromethanopterin reductase-like flavin-dependent oxidoreductase (luciferase family)